MSQRIDVPGLGIVEFPDGMSDDQISSAIKANLNKSWEGSSNQEKKPYDPMKSLENAPGSALKFAGGIAKSILHPLDTAQGLFDAAAGGLRNITPKAVSDVIDRADVTQGMRAGQQRATQQADAVGQAYKDRYGGWENTKRTMEGDPVGALADLSTVLGIGSGVTGIARTGAAAFPSTAKAAPIISGVANDLATASKFTNPLSVIPPTLRALGKARDVGFGFSTGVGPEATNQAYQAGKNVRPAFLENLRSETPVANLLDTAKQGIETMRQAKSAEYRQNMIGVTSDRSVLSFDGIDKAIQNARGKVTFKGQVKSDSAAQVVKSMADDVAEWKRLDPAEFHTPEGLDALKQRLGDALEKIPYEQQRARLAAGEIYNAVKSEITKQAPTYAKTMEDYSKASEQIREIERGLSLGAKSSQDTAIRKLQSLSRNNVNTNYGNRLSMAKALEEQGNVDLMPSIAGQAMNSWTPRGLVGQAGLGATGYAALTNPAALALLPLQSPKAVGLGLYGTGRAAGIGGRAATKLGLTPERARLAGLLGYELNRDW